MLPLIISNIKLRSIIFRNHFKKSITSLSTPRLQHQLSEFRNGSCEYPPIVDMSLEGQRKHQRKLWYDSIKAMPTVEEKLYELAVQQRIKLKKFLVCSVAPTYSATSFFNFITRTHLVEGLPDQLIRMNVDNELSDVKDVFNDSLLNYYCNPWQSGQSWQLSDYLNEKDAGCNFLKILLSQCYKKLSLKNDYIMESTIQRMPSVSSFWCHGGFESKKNKIFETNLYFRYRDTPAFVIRMKKPLSEIISMDNPLCATGEVPDLQHHPKVYGVQYDTSWLSSVPGFWPGDPQEFPLLLVHTYKGLQKLQSNIEKYDIKKIEDSCGTMASFGYLNAVATYQGFTPFHDLTYPLVTQMILTNGQDWNFFVYQLNTIAFHSDVDNKDRRNICWSSGKLRLFDAIEDGQIRGINDEVYKLLLKFLLNAPVLKDGLVLKPYVGVDTRTEEEAQNMRYFARKMYSQAPEHGAHKDEIPTWQRIYKYHKEAPPSPYVKMD